MSKPLPGFKEHFFWDDKGEPGTIDNIILTMDRFIKNSQKDGSDIADKKEEYKQEIERLTDKIRGFVKGKLGKDTDKFVQFCSDHYRDKVYGQQIAETYAKTTFKKRLDECSDKESDEAWQHSESKWSEQNRSDMKKFIEENYAKLDEDITDIVQGFIYKREQLWGAKKRTKGKSEKVAPTDNRDVTWMLAVRDKLFEAKSIVEKAAQKEPSWKENKLKIVVNAKKRKLVAAPKIGNYEKELADAKNRKIV